jgi:hypothetical protein
MTRFHEHARTLVGLPTDFTGLFLQPHLTCEHYSGRVSAHENDRDRACDDETPAAFLSSLGIAVFSASIGFSSAYAPGCVMALILASRCCLVIPIP